MITIFIDTETTGTSFEESSIIQISGIVREDGVDKETFNFRMRPYKEEPVTDGAFRANGISQAEAETYPDQREAFEQFLQILDKYHLGTKDLDTGKYKRAKFCGYNSNFDMQMVVKWFEFNTQIDRSYRKLFNYFYQVDIDVLRIGFALLDPIINQMPNFKLVTMYETVFGKQFEHAHDAMFDILATEQLYDFFGKADPLLNFDLLKEPKESPDQLLFNFEEKPKIPVRQKKN